MNTQGLISDIQTNLLWEEEMIKEVLRIQSNMDLNKITDKDISFYGVCDLAEMLGVSLDSIIESNIDYSVVRKKFIAPSTAIPDEFLPGAGSYMSSVRILYRTVEQKVNKVAALDTLHRNQIDKNVLLKDEVMVNMDLINDLYEHTGKTLGFNKRDYEDMALLAYKDCPRKMILDLAENTSNDKELLKLFVEGSKSYEKNFDYDFEEMRPGVYKVKSVSKEEIHDTLKKTVIANDIVLNYKAAALVTLPLLLGRKKLNLLDIETYTVNGRQHANFYFKENNLSNLC